MSNRYISLSILDTLEDEVVKKILKEPLDVVCKNFETEQHELNKLNLLYKKDKIFWKNNNSKWTYYIKEKDIHNFIPDITEEDKVEFHGFTDNYSTLLKMSNKERIEALSSNKSRLKELELKRVKDSKEIGDAVVSGTSDSIMLNKVIFDDLAKMTPEKAKELSQHAVNETSEIVKIASNLLTDFPGDYSIFSNIIEKSNGTTIKHMTRTFIMTLSYFKYYNHLLNSGYAARIRATFDLKYRDKYEKLLPHLNFHIIKLEKVFKGGMATIPELETNAIGVGFLLHDIGKQVDLEYFEGAEGYVKERIQAHVTNGFNELLKRTVYPPVVSAIAGFHHEYYGHSSGYGPLRDFISKKFPKGIQPDYCLSYSLHEVYKGEALCFFPAKMLEIVDVYDALTDPGRKYRDPLTPVLAVEFIRDKFLKDDIKLDPILFDMFELFLINSGEITK